MVSHRREALTHLYCTAFDCADFIDLHPRYDGTAYPLCISILPTVLHHIDNML